MVLQKFKCKKILISLRWNKRAVQTDGLLICQPLLYEKNKFVYEIIGLF